MRDSIKWAAFAALTLTACSRGDKPDTFIQATLKAAAGEPVAVWQALPPSYQKDVNDVVGAFAAKVPEQPYNDGFVIAGKVVKVLETKKTFVLGHPALKSGPINAEGLAKAWDPAVHFLSTLVNSDIKTVAGLKAFDMAKFLQGPATVLIKDGLALAESAGDAIPNKGAAKLTEMKEKLKGAKITIESAADDKATVKVEIPNEKTESTEMVKVEGKWLPKEMVDSWPSAIAGAKASISTIEVPPEMIVQFNAMKGAVDPVLDGLLAADSQDGFNAQVETLMKGLMGGRGGAAEPPPPAPEPEMDAPAAEPSPTAAAKSKAKKRRTH